MMSMLCLAASVAATPAFEQRFDSVDGLPGIEAADGAGALAVNGEPIKAVMPLGAAEEISATDGKDFVLQYEVSYPDEVSCQGSYIKLISAGQEGDVTPDSKYTIMFGPDKCGYDNNKIHFIYQIKNPNTGEMKEVWADVTDADAGLNAKLYDDGKTSLLTLIIKDDDTWTVEVDNQGFATGKLCDDETSIEGHYCSEPETVPDPASTKPEDWVDETEIQDPEDVQPEDWVTEREIVDPEAAQPEDWDPEMDGEWEAPTIDNPDFKGDYEFKKIANPAYTGEWVQATIDNVAYVPELPSAQSMMSKFESVVIDVTANAEGVKMDDILVLNSDTAVVDALAEAENNWAPEEAAQQKAIDKKKAEDDAAAEKAAAEEEAAPAEAGESAQVPWGGFLAGIVLWVFMYKQVWN
jgi:calreticulin